jgi:hypothetical protein
MCLQVVYEAAEDPTICDRIYLQGVVPNCLEYYAQHPPASTSRRTIRPPPRSSPSDASADWDPTSVPTPTHARPTYRWIWPGYDLVFFAYRCIQSPLARSAETPAWYLIHNCLPCSSR